MDLVTLMGPSKNAKFATVGEIGDSVQEGLKLWISSKRDGTLFDGIETAIENNEARFQLIEGCS